MEVIEINYNLFGKLKFEINNDVGSIVSKTTLIVFFTFIKKNLSKGQLQSLNNDTQVATVTEDRRA